MPRHKIKEASVLSFIFYPVSFIFHLLSFIHICWTNRLPPFVEIEKCFQKLNFAIGSPAVCHQVIATHWHTKTIVENPLILRFFKLHLNKLQDKAYDKVVSEIKTANSKKEDRKPNNIAVFSAETLLNYFNRIKSNNQERLTRIHFVYFPVPN